MDERLERDLRQGLAALLDPIEGNHPRWTGSPAAGRIRRAPARPRWNFRLEGRWAFALAAVLIVCLVATAAFLGWRFGRAVVTTPIRTPAASATAQATPTPMPRMTVIGQESDVLATTNAHALPAQASCPPGSDPGTPGALYQERPSYGSTPMVFDRHAGVIVALAAEGSGWQKSRTWTFDVCTNTWQSMHPSLEPPDSVNGLVYDADSDRTVAVTVDGQIWSYDLTADRWAMGGALSQSLLGYYETFFGFSPTFGAVYDDRSGLVVLYGNSSRTMWAYDVESNTLARVRQRPDPSLPSDSGLPPDVTTRRYEGGGEIGYDPRNDLIVVHLVPPTLAAQTWTFSPRTGSWRQETAATTPKVWSGYGFAAPAAYDPGTGLLVLPLAESVGWDISSPYRMWAFDSGGLVWRGPVRVSCAGYPPVFDSVNSRLVCQAGTYPRTIYSGMATFSLDGRQTWLLEQLPVAASEPPINAGTDGP